MLHGSNDASDFPGFSNSLRKVRRKSASSVENPPVNPISQEASSDTSESKTISAPRQNRKVMKRHRSASATPSSPHYTVPTVSSMNMKSPIISKRSSELTRKKKHLEVERDEKLEDIRRKNRLYKHDLYRQLEEQQEERAKYVEEIKKTKRQKNKLSESMN
ncbi:hypothetical protein XU18_1577 [Perkinsela sp. CCAP 1560/4]|nr:hypothetical protein XU18_1577 [Perkinsela sp. CCAP 1560/4]|eukprot:KNH07807.1 hypothetical protein XU18_1577 [Perkinsela sp. CCAP 1560/4]